MSKYMIEIDTENATFNITKDGVVLNDLDEFSAGKYTDTWRDPDNPQDIVYLSYTDVEEDGNETKRTSTSVEFVKDAKDTITFSKTSSGIAKEIHNALTKQKGLSALAKALKGAK